MGALTQLSLLLRKSWYEKKRHPVASACDVLLPIALLALLVLLHSVIPIEVFNTKTYATNLRDVQSLASVSRWLLQSNLRLGIAPDTAATRELLQRFDFAYPGINVSAALNTSDPNAALLNVPKFSDAVMMFDTEQALEDHVRDASYEDGAKLYAALVVHSGAPHWDYSIRFNSTIVPMTTESEDRFSRGVRWESLDEYMYATFGASMRGGRAGVQLPGFTSFQIALDKVITNVTATEGHGVNDASLVGGAWWLLSRHPAELPAFEDVVESARLTAAAAGFNPSATSPNPNDAELLYREHVARFMRSEALAPQRMQAASFPVHRFNRAPFYVVLAEVFSLYFVLTFLVPVFHMIRGLVGEKESKIREGLNMMGMADVVQPLSWLVTYFAVFTVTAALAILITFSNIFSSSNPLLIFLLFLLFGWSSAAFAVLISTLFSRARTAAVLGSVIFLAGFFPYYATSPGNIGFGAKLASCLASPTSFALALNYVAQWERDSIGVHFDNMSMDVANFNFITPLYMMAVDVVLYLLLAWYLDKVMPRDYGVQHKPWFLFTREYWRPSTGLFSAHAGAAPKAAAGAAAAAPAPARRAGKGGAVQDNEEKGMELPERGGPGVLPVSPVPLQAEQADNADIEPPSASLQALAAEERCVHIRGLRKEFPTPDGTKVAVKALDLTMYEGQIFALLGHNGAGKTTTLSILSGMLPATAGDATVYGMSVATQMGSIRHMMGMCPQHDVLFPDLTVKEHLELFAGLKEVPQAVRAEKVSEIIAEVGLTEKVDAQSRTLSGGMKRKLSLAIALLGDSRIVFLDEPTSGMDPYSRRSTWSVIQNNRQGRIIVLTTHFMDEADLLGDRIGIMADGELRCCGSPMFLKARFGVGYNLTLVRTPQGDARQLGALVRSHVPTAKMLSSVGAEVAFQLPLGATTAFPRLFDAVDELKGRSVQSYGLSVTTMEEVFLKVAQHGKLEEQEEATQLVRRLSSARNITSRSVLPTTGTPRKRSGSDADVEAASAPPVKDADLNVSSLPYRNQFWPHLVTLLAKRLNYSKRDKKMIVFQLLIPVLALVAGLQLLSTGSFSSQPALRFSAADFNPHVPPPARHTSQFPYAIYPELDQLEATLTQRFMAAAPTGMGILSGPEAQPLPDMTTAACVYELAQQQCKPKDNTCILPERATGVPFPVAESRANGTVCGELDWDGRHLRALALSEYLLRTAGDFAASRYGAGFFAVANNETNQYEAVVLSNTSGIHALPLFANYMMNVMLRGLAREAGTPEAELPSIQITSHPLPFTKRQDALVQSVGAFVAAMFVIIAFAFIPASVAIFIVRERETNVKHQQLLSGVSIPAYWVSSFLWDFTCYLVPFGASVLIIHLYDISSFTEGEAFTAVVLCFFAYGAATIAFTYLVSFLFTHHTTAQNLLLLANLFMLFMMIASFVMMQFDSTCKVNGVLRWVYHLFPGYSLGDALVRLSLIQVLPQIDAMCSKEPVAPGTRYSAMDFKVVGPHLLMLAATAVLYFVLAVLYDYARSTPSLRARFTRQPHVAVPPHADDEDVAAEAQRVASGAADDDTILLQDLRKVYPGSPPKIAVRGMSFGIPRGECFGFLGINGAGKTTTMKMLTGDILATGGSARLAGFDIMTQQLSVRRLLGYCPQFDALLDLLTVREHLEMFARIKGFRGDQVPRLVEAKLDQLGLRPFENKLAHTLSGGNKRKLSVAIALIGNPPLVFLDEPSTGVDPAARREMWKVLAEMSTARQECSIVLTTHSMEECEALCSRVGIMVGGRLRCLGSVQHLKNRFGRGYMFEVKLNPPSQPIVEQLEEQVSAVAPDGFITPANLLDACTALGDPSRAREFTPEGSAWLLHAAMHRDGNTTTRSLAVWWQSGLDAGALNDFMARHFPGCALLEHHSDMFRYTVPSLPSRIGAVFALLEAHKQELHIREYSISQTTLEQIFNSFASQQEEEKGHVHGMESNFGVPEAAADSPKRP